MTPPIRSGTPEGDAMLAIRRRARESGGDVQEIMTLYVLEALLARLARSERRDDFVLKGGVLLAAFAARRPTKDIDLEALRMSNDIDAVVERLRGIAAIDVGDGVAFDAAAARGDTIREGADYVGVRVRLDAAIGRSRVTIGVDVNFGDPIVPDAVRVDLPRVVPTPEGPIRLLGYPLTMVFAEKLLTAVERGEANTRWRDFADVYTLMRLRPVEASDLTRSLKAVASHRGVTVEPLLPRTAPGMVDDAPTIGQSASSSAEAAALGRHGGHRAAQVGRVAAPHRPAGRPPGRVRGRPRLRGAFRRPGASG